MNVFALSLISSVAAGVIAALMAAKEATMGTAFTVVSALTGALVGAGIYMFVGWLAVKVAAADSQTTPEFSVRTTVVGIAAVLFVIASPFATWLFVGGVLRIAVRAFGG